MGVMDRPGWVARQRFAGERRELSTSANVRGPISMPASG
ncbi:hypothetical protein GFS60_06909 (plasmid) [Rhodococcus sp. WAY2]|nr:hypothetical protein GFS60_06909 [Rhodococcus sp. WAY2]